MRTTYIFFYILQLTYSFPNHYKINKKAYELKNINGFDSEILTNEQFIPVDNEIYGIGSFENIEETPTICKKDNHVIEHEFQLDKLQRECNEIFGSIEILNFTGNIINLGKIEKISGGFTVRNSGNILKIESDILKQIGGYFKIEDLTALSSIYLPALTHFDIIEWKVVPILNSLTLHPKLEAGRGITISDSSLVEINNFEGIKDLQILNVNNNRFLENIKINVKHISEKLSISGNAKTLNLYMPELEWANNIIIRDSMIVTLPKLQYVNESLEFIENHFEMLELTNLKYIGGTLGIIENKQLQKADLSNVTNIVGGLMINGNDKTRNIDFLPNLQQIGGAIQFTGNIDKTYFPSLKLVKGSAVINSKSKLDCSQWNMPVHSYSFIRGGKIQCISNQKNNINKPKEINLEDDVLDDKYVVINQNTGSSNISKTVIFKILDLSVFLLFLFYLLI